MKTVFSLLLLLMMTSPVSSQNLVPNPSFEEFRYDWFNMTLYCCADHWLPSWRREWQQWPYCHDDYVTILSECYNYYYLQTPRTGYGQVYTIVFHYPGIPQRRYNQVKLKQQLKPDAQYCVSFYVKLYRLSHYAVGNFSAYFSNDTLYPSAPQTCLFLTPQIDISVPIVTDTVNWLKISGNFIAQGNENFIAIGNFLDDQNTNYAICNNSPYSSSSVYFFDDVAVYPCDAPIFVAKAAENKELEMCKGDSVRLGSHELDEYMYAWFVAGNDMDTLSTMAQPRFSPGTTTTYVLKVKDFKFDETSDTVTVKVIPCGKNNNLHIFPNPGSGLFSLQTDFPVKGKTEVTVFNTIGQKLKHTVYQSDEYTTTFALNLENFAAGVYHVRFKTADETLSGKVVMVK